MLWITSFIVFVTLSTYDTNCVTGQLDERVEEIFGPPNPIGRYPIPPTTALPQCECVPYYLCNGTEISTNGEGVIEKRSNEGRCPHFWERCCFPKNRTRSKLVSPRKYIPTGCGYRRRSGVAMETLGITHNEANFGEFPWMVAIIEEKVLGYKMLIEYQGGGSLIHPRVVLTAAHRVDDCGKAYKIRAGEWDTQTNKETLKHQDCRVQSVIIHPDYCRAPLFYDVALLILEDPVKLDQHISVACLPQASTVIPAGTECWASGWGKNLFGAEGKYSVILKKVDLPFAESSACQSRLRTTILGKYFQLHESFVCAGGIAGKDMCQGDGGSPLVCPIPGQVDRYQQIGMVAWGIGCGGNGIPGVYVNVALFKEWIDTEMEKQNLDMSQYQY